MAFSSPDQLLPLQGAPTGTPWASVPAADWLDWRWQLQHRLSSADELATWLPVSPELRDFLDKGQGFEVGITPYFASLARPGDLSDPIARQVLPDPRENRHAAFERLDPLGEDPHRKAPGLIHKYPDRVLLLVTDRCAAYCRYCTRARWVATGSELLGQDELDQAIAYIERTPAITDVLISGGDPLLLTTARLRRLLDRLAAIDHLRFIRLGSRVPIFLPMRIDAELAATLRPRRIPIFVNVHINHFSEITALSRQALGLLADAGVPLGGQAVLLRGVNDNAATLRETFYAMLSARVRPYYLFHCDPVRGTAHLRTSVSQGLALMRALIGHTSGMAIPKYCIDLEGAGKVPLWPQYVQAMQGESMVVNSYLGETWEYVNELVDSDDR